MPRLRIVAKRSLFAALTFAIVSSMTFIGCGDSRTESPVAQATAGQASAKSSMDYMRKHVAEKKPTNKSKTRGR